MSVAITCNTSLTLGVLVESIDRRVVYVLNETVDYLLDKISHRVHHAPLFPILLNLLHVRDRGSMSWKKI